MAGHRDPATRHELCAEKRKGEAMGVSAKASRTGHGLSLSHMSRKSREEKRLSFFFSFLAALGLCCGARASHCGGFSCCGARALAARASVVVARGLQ